jgi:DNA-directed RNA polymerase specialized sigma24 family protein
VLVCTLRDAPEENIMDDKDTRRPRPAPEAASELDLIARAQRGEEAAFFALYELHKAQVYSICLRLLGAAEEAEGLTRNIFLWVFRKISVVRDEDEFSALLQEAAVHSALAVRRARALAHQLGPSQGNASEAKRDELAREEASQRRAESTSVSQRKKRLRPQLVELDARPRFWIRNS